MRLFLFADPHVENHRWPLGQETSAGVNLRGKLAGEAVGEALTAAAGQLNCDAGVGLGDIFDQAKPRPEIVAVVAEKVAEAHLPVWLIPGNHDQSTTDPGHNALAPLQFVDGCFVADEPMVLLPGQDRLSLAGNHVGVELLLAPYRPDCTEYLTKLVEKHRPRALLAHVGIVDRETMPPFLLTSKTVDLDTVVSWGRFGLEFFASGDFHSHRVWEREVAGVVGDNILTPATITVVQVGALCQADFGDQPPLGRGVVYDTETGSYEVVSVPCPRLLDFSLADLGLFCDGLAGSDQHGDAHPASPLFIRVRCAAGAEAEEAERKLAEVVVWARAHGDRPRVVFTTVETESAEATCAAEQVTAAYKSIDPDEVIAGWASEAAGGDEQLAQDAASLMVDLLAGKEVVLS